MYASIKEKDDVRALLEGWSDDPNDMKRAFVMYQERLLEIEGVTLSFISRPGVTYSLRGTTTAQKQKDLDFFVMVDVIDDQTDGRWLSVCFYADLVSDPDEQGDLVPGGLAGADGYCFDLFEYEDESVAYVAQRIEEACKNSMT